MESKGVPLHNEAEAEGEEKEEEEYVLLDLDAISQQIPIPPNAPYVLSGLDTLNPILTIDNKIKLIGEYEETIGTCYVFTESDAAVPVNEESGSSRAKFHPRKCKMDTQRNPAKKITPLTSLHKILKFRPLLEADDSQDPKKQVHETS